MAKMIITTGLPASGKTTWAKNFLSSRSVDEWRRVNWDEDRITLGMAGKAFSPKAEGKMQDASFANARAWAQQGNNLLIDNTNLSSKTMNKWLAIGIENNMEVEIKDFPTSVEDCIRFDASRRSDCVGRAVIERMALFAGRIDFGEYSKYIIVDIDGTMADTTARQHHLIPEPCKDCLGTGFKSHLLDEVCLTCEGKGVPKNFKKNWAAWLREVGTENVREDVHNIVQVLSRSYQVLLVSGRSIDAAGKKTVDWLLKNRVEYRHLFMRNGGDSRDDTIIKQEILNQILTKISKDRIILAIDDRPRIIRMWQSNGIKVLDVGNQKEF